MNDWLGYLLPDKNKTEPPQVVRGDRAVWAPLIGVVVWGIFLIVFAASLAGLLR